jgi:hypothetical protein
MHTYLSGQPSSQASSEMVMSSFRECFETESSGKVFRSMLTEIATLRAVRLEDGSKSKVWRLKSELQVGAAGGAQSSGPSRTAAAKAPTIVAAAPPNPGVALPSSAVRPHTAVSVNPPPPAVAQVKQEAPQENEVIDLT